MSINSNNNSKNNKQKKNVSGQPRNVFNVLRHAVQGKMKDSLIPEVDKNVKDIELAVPLTVPVPFVQEMIASGAGIKLGNDSLGIDAKVVKRGKNAASGRGVVANNVMLVKQLDESDIQKITAETNTVNDIDVVQVGNEQPIQGEQQTEVLVPDENQQSPQGQVDIVQPIQGQQQLFTKSELETVLLGPKVAGTDSVPPDPFIDGLPIAEPNYVDDVWACSSANEQLRNYKQKLKEKARKDNPTFTGSQIATMANKKADNTNTHFKRRVQQPAPFLIREYDTSPYYVDDDTGKITNKRVRYEDLLISNDGSDIGVGNAGNDDSSAEGISCNIQEYGCIMTFHSDGTFTWPKSSKHKCWNCCHNFSGPPAMIPKHYNRVMKYYLVYGNFCGWPCAKRFSVETNHDYYSETSPPIDHFAFKYFGQTLPLQMAPPRFVLQDFSDFGMSIDDYRNIGKVSEDKQSVMANFVVVEPPIVPYEILVMY